MKDLLVVVADSNMKGIMDGLLPRMHRIETTAPFSYAIRVHPMRDAGVRTQIVDFVGPDSDDFRNLLVFLDYEGSGSSEPMPDLQSRIEEDLRNSGWADRVCVVVFDPECDVWMWVNRNKMSEVFRSPRGNNFPNNVDDWLQAKGFSFVNSKPERPKEALEELCREIRLPRSSSLYEQLAASASYRDCTDPGFLRFRNFILEKFSID
jgi:hypothetical protein